MDIPLRRKYRTHDGVQGFKAKPRTGNSHGGEKGRKKSGRTDAAPPRTMHVDGLTGRKQMRR